MNQHSKGPWKTLTSLNWIVARVGSSHRLQFADVLSVHIFSAKLDNQISKYHPSSPNPAWMWPDLAKNMRKYSFHLAKESYKNRIWSLDDHNSSRRQSSSFFWSGVVDAVSAPAGQNVRIVAQKKGETCGCETVSARFCKRFFEWIPLESQNSNLRRDRTSSFFHVCFMGVFPKEKTSQTLRICWWSLLRIHFNSSSCYQNPLQTPMTPSPLLWSFVTQLITILDHELEIIDEIWLL